MKLILQHEGNDITVVDEWDFEWEYLGDAVYWDAADRKWHLNGRAEFLDRCIIDALNELLFEPAAGTAP